MFRKKKETYSVIDEFKQYFNQINDSNIKLYIENRIFNQMNWYDRKSIYFQNQYKKFTIINLCLSATIPVILLLQDVNPIIFKSIIAIFSGCIAIITGYLSLNKSKELWLEYRHSCETLKSYLHKYFTDSEPFNGEPPNKDELLIKLSEEVMNHEIGNWIITNNQKEKTYSTNS